MMSPNLTIKAYLHKIMGFVLYNGRSVGRLMSRISRQSIFVAMAAIGLLCLSVFNNCAAGGGTTVDNPIQSERVQFQTSNFDSDIDSFKLCPSHVELSVDSIEFDFGGDFEDYLGITFSVEGTLWTAKLGKDGLPIIVSEYLEISELIELDRNGGNLFALNVPTATYRSASISSSPNCQSGRSAELVNNIGQFSSDVNYNITRPRNLIVNRETKTIEFQVQSFSAGLVEINSDVNLDIYLQNPMISPREMFFSKGLETIYIYDPYSSNQLIAADSSSGLRRIISGVDHGSGSPVSPKAKLLGLTPENKALLVDPENGLVINIDLNSGDRSIVSSNFNLTEEQLDDLYIGVSKDLKTIFYMNIEWGEGTSEETFHIRKFDLNSGLSEPIYSFVEEYMRLGPMGVVDYLGSPHIVVTENDEPNGLVRYTITSTQDGETALSGQFPTNSFLGTQTRTNTNTMMAVNNVIYIYMLSYNPYISPGQDRSQYYRFRIDSESSDSAEVYRPLDSEGRNMPSGSKMSVHPQNHDLYFLGSTTREISRSQLFSNEFSIVSSNGMIGELGEAYAPYLLIPGYSISTSNLFVVDHNFRVFSVDIDSGTLTQFDDRTFHKFRYAEYDTETDHFYFSHAGGTSRYNPITKEEESLFSCSSGRRVSNNQLYPWNIDENEYLSVRTPSPEEIENYNFEIGVILDRIDQDTGECIQVSGPEVGSGPPINIDTRVVFDRHNNIAYAISHDKDSNELKIMRIDTSTGNREFIYSEEMEFSTISTSWYDQINLSPDKRYLYFVKGSWVMEIYRYNIQTGEVELVSGTNRGIGFYLLGTNSIAFNGDGSIIYLYDPFVKGLVEIDVATGDRKIFFLAY